MPNALHFTEIHHNRAMENTQGNSSTSGFHQLLIVILLILIPIAGAVGFWLGQQSALPPGTDAPIAVTPLPHSSAPSPVSSVQPTQPGDDQVVCTLDALECPDGTYVGRTGPNCEFVCPAEE